MTLDDLADFFKQCGVVKVSKSITMVDHPITEIEWMLREFSEVP